MFWPKVGPTLKETTLNEPLKNSNVTTKRPKQVCMLK